MAIFYERRDRPGVHKIIGSLRGAAGDVAPGGSGGDSGGGSAAGVLSVSDDGVLTYSGQAPTMDGNTLVFTPTPTMAGTVMTI